MSAAAIAAPLLAPVFTDHMVLQRDAVLPFWGTAEARAEVTVTLGNTRVSTFADAGGRWTVRLPKQAASAQPQTVTVSLNGQPAVLLSDVLIGDVWLCAGQSNMEFRCSQESTWATEQAAAGMPSLRLLNMGFAGQGIGAAAYSAAVVERQTAEQFYNPATWTASSAATAVPFSAVGYFFGKEILNSQQVPVGLIHCAVGGSPAEAWMRRDVLPQPFLSPDWLNNTSLLEPWCNGRARVQLGALAATAPGDALGPNHSFKPSFLWNAGPARLLPFAIRGVLWYQGESNALSHLDEAGVSDPAWRVKQHETLFPALVKDWRAQWGQGDFPFLICQLSSISATAYDSHFWPEFRDQQRRHAESIPGAGLAVTSDIGHASNVHPANKRDVGRRLARWARRYVYAEPAVLPCPLPYRGLRSGNSVTLSLRHAGTSLATSDGQAAASFELAGADGVWHAATASIQGPSILITSPVAAPLRLRYGWQPFSAGNIVNADGLPLTTFDIPVSP